MKNKSWTLLLLSVASASSLCSCGSGTFATPLTDALKFTETFTESDKFISPSDGVHAIGEITISSVVDGDTLNFYNGRNVDIKKTSDISYTVRFNGINTPESTARIEPWGVKASQYVKSILWDSQNEKQRPYSVVLINDIATYGQLDGTSERYIGFVWYKMNEDSDYRLLNLEIIEQCYSLNLLSAHSDYCPYYATFVEAARVAKQNGKRVYGEKDPDYDYTDTILDVSIRYVRDNYQALGVSDTDSLDESSSGVKLRITALIVGFSGDNFFLRDVTDADNNGEYASIYAYAALSITAAAKSFKVGQIVRFVCKATKYKNNVQLTDLKNVSTSQNDDDKIKILFDPRTVVRQITDNPSLANISQAQWDDKEIFDAIKAKANELNYAYDLSAYDYVDTFNNISDISTFDNYLGGFLKIKITIRKGDEDDQKPTMNEQIEDYFRYDSDGRSLTFFAKTSLGAKISIRSLEYGLGYYGKGTFEVDKSYYVIGQLARHEKTYQLVLVNSNLISPTKGINYVTPAE